MARTPLMRALVSLARRQMEAARAPLATDVPRDRTQLTRRQFVSAMAGFGAAACAPRARHASPRTTPVAIVGAGIAGLTAAHTLAAAGIPVTLYAASHRIGGRMHSHREGWDDGQVTEWCGELIDGNHETILGLARRFELPLTDLQAAQPQGSEPAYFLRGHPYAWWQAVADFAAVREVLARDFRGVGARTTFAESTPQAVQLDGMSPGQRPLRRRALLRRLPGLHGRRRRRRSPRRERGAPRPRTVGRSRPAGVSSRDAGWPAARPRRACGTSPT